MSFRIEEKLFIKKNYILDFKKYINSKLAIKIYEPRIIESLYFDNKNFQMYKDSKGKYFTYLSPPPKFGMSLSSSVF